MPDQALFLLLNLGADTPPPVLAGLRFVSSGLMAYLVVATAAVACVGRTPWRGAAMQALLAMVLAALLAHVLKQQFGAPRPFMLGLGTQWLAHGSGPGFPSSHAAAVAAWAAAGLGASRRLPLRLLFCAVATLVGYSRVALGLHFPADVAAGWLLGALCALAARQLAVRAARASRILAASRLHDAPGAAGARPPRQD